MKKKRIAQYQLADTNPKHYEEDHLIPLEIGGDPHDPKNLWLELWESEWSAKKKDQLENTLHRMMCNGEIPLGEAQRAFATNWMRHGIGLCQVTGNIELGAVD